MIYETMYMTNLWYFDFSQLKLFKKKIFKSNPIADSNMTNERLNNLTTFKGQQMIFKTEEEVDVYFQQLQNDW